MEDLLIGLGLTSGLMASEPIEVDASDIASSCLLRDLLLVLLSPRERRGEPISLESTRDSVDVVLSIFWVNSDSGSSSSTVKIRDSLNLCIAPASTPPQLSGWPSSLRIKSRTALAGLEGIVPVARKARKMGCGASGASAKIAPDLDFDDVRLSRRKCKVRLHNAPDLSGGLPPGSEVAKRWGKLTSPSMASWQADDRNMDTPFGVPIAPTRDDHERHLERIDRFLKRMRRQPRSFRDKVDRKRSDLEDQDESENQVLLHQVTFHKLHLARHQQSHGDPDDSGERVG